MATMFKASAKLKDDRTLLVFGLSSLNLERLSQKEPLYFQTDELGIKANVLMFVGETEEAIEAQLREAGIVFPEKQEAHVPPSPLDPVTHLANPHISHPDDDANG
jgi:hypothetical protein